MPFYATVGPICLLDGLLERFPFSEVAVGLKSKIINPMTCEIKIISLDIQRLINLIIQLDMLKNHC